MKVLSSSFVHIECLFILIRASGALVAASLELYFHDTTFDDLLPTEVTQWSPADTALQCGRRCQKETWCNSFFYNPHPGTCALQRMAYVSLMPNQTSTARGWSYYRLTSEGCPAKGGYVIDRLTATCYRLVTSTLPLWIDARAACEDSGEMLVVLEPVEKARFIYDFLNTNIALHNFWKGIFTGCIRPLDEWNTPVPSTGPRFVWLNGQPVDLNATQTFWFQGSNWYGQSRNVVVMRFDESYLWAPARDIVLRFYICERSYM